MTNVDNNIAKLTAQMDELLEMQRNMYKPIKPEEKKKSDGAKIRSQKKLFEMIERNLNKEFHGGTKPSCDFIYKIVEDAYNDGVKYQIPDDLKKRILAFAKNSTHHSKDCVKLMKKMHYASEDYAMEEEKKSNSLKIREFIIDVLNREDLMVGDPIDTKVTFDMINECLQDAYNSGIAYDVRDVRSKMLSYATQCMDTDTVTYCLSFMNERMPFCSENPIESDHKDDSRAIIFYDIEVFPNMFLVNWKIQGEGQPIVRWINPTPEQIEDLIQFRLIGFNCRRYDNHLIYARLMGYDNNQLYHLSQKIVSGLKGCFFGPFLSSSSLNS